MNNLDTLQQTYIQSEPLQQLESIADRLGRIATICNESNDLNLVTDLIRESQYLIE